MGKELLVALCGDLWFDEHIERVKDLKPDVVLWPVYTDFNVNEWNSSMKYDYAAQAGRCCDTVLYVNSVCLDREGEEIAKGGAALFQHGRIIQDLPAGKEAILLVEI